MKIVAVTALYPTPRRPEHGVFVRSFLEALRECGAELTVLAPESRARRIGERIAGGSDGTPEVGVLRPSYWSVSGRLLPWGRLGEQLSFRSFERVVAPSIRPLLPVDGIYAHFFSTGLATLASAERAGVPCIVNLGESDLPDVAGRWTPPVFDSALRRFSAIVAVSQENFDFCNSRPGVDPRKVFLLPNGVDQNQFKPSDKASARRRLGLPTDRPIAIYVGHFIERKGARRVLAALAQLPDVFGVFLGAGPQHPSGPQVIRAERIAHPELPDWLAAADVFVLPSLAEGMSNAILEALACGVPLVVSDRPFNRSFLSETCAEFVNPEDPSDIARAIDRVLKNDERRAAMKASALALARHHSIHARARSLLQLVGRCRAQ